MIPYLLTNKRRAVKPLWKLGFSRCQRPLFNKTLLLADGFRKELIVVEEALAPMLQGQRIHHKSTCWKKEVQSYRRFNPQDRNFFSVFSKEEFKQKRTFKFNLFTSKGLHKNPDTISRGKYETPSGWVLSIFSWINQLGAFLFSALGNFLLPQSFSSFFVHF